jgi:hypothetical protein
MPCCGPMGAPNPPLPRPLTACALAAMLAGCALSTTPSAQVSGLLLDERLGEVSGLAASRRHGDLLWVHNDGGGGPFLYALGTRGGLRGALEIEGVINTDWEDLAAFTLDGTHYLLVADTGDNGGLRHTLQLHVVAEPETIVDNTRLPAAWSIAFRWPDGPRDCEAVAVDVENGRILLVSKKRRPPQVFSLPLRPPGEGVQVAELVGTLAGVPVPSEAERQANPGKLSLRGLVTAADLSPDGRRLAVLTYEEVLVYERAEGQAWEDAFAGSPRVQSLPLLPQAEALGWSADGTRLYATGEFRPAPLLLLNPDP